MLFLKKSCFLVLFLFYISLSYSQISPNSFGNLSIAEDGFLTIFGHHNFMTGAGLLKPGIIRTNRSLKPGYLIYATESTWSGASKEQYIDGYVKSYHTDKFSFPLGHKGHYRPICLSSPHSSSAAYYHDNPKMLKGIVPESIFNISQVEYWEIDLMRDSQLTLSWSGGSKIEDVLGNQNLDQLTIIGLNQYNIWEIIPSSIDENVLNVSVHFGDENKYTKSKKSLGSITSIDKINSKAYKYFTLASLEFKQDLKTATINVYPNPQLVGSKINVEHTLNKMGSGILRIFKSDNSLLYELKLSQMNENMQLPYFIRESGSYILSITDSSGSTTFENLIVVDK